MIKEHRVTLKNLGKIDPRSIDDYLNAGGYDSFRKALKMDHVEVIDEMVKSALEVEGELAFRPG